MTTSVTHDYAAVGTYTVTAAPVQQCQGGAQKSLTVGADTRPKAGLDTSGYLCEILKNCGRPQAALQGDQKLTALPPYLGGIFPFSVFEPGGDVIVTGQNFGNTAGELHL